MALLSEQDLALVKSLSSRLASYDYGNEQREAYYRGRYYAPSLGIGIPPNSVLNKVTVGWASTVVDTIEERIEFLGWSDASGEDDELLSAVYESSDVGSESSAVHSDALMYGIGFLSVTAGGAGEPEVLVRAHSARSTTAEINPRTGLVEAGITYHSNKEATLWKSDEIVELVRGSEHGVWEVAERIPHSMGRVPLVAVVNRTRAGDRRGRSEITPGIITAINSATRALRAMDVNREFFSTPQRYGIGLSEENFEGVDSWKLISTRMLLAPRDEEEGTEPKFGEFSTVSPGPYLDQIKGLASLVATESGIPESYFNIPHSNPTSADAVRAMENRLIKRAERRCRQFTSPWVEVGRLARAVVTGHLDVEDSPRVRWADPATPTLAATTDAMVKAVQSGVLPVGEVVWRRMGLSEHEIESVESVQAEARAGERLARLANITRGVSEEALIAAGGEAYGRNADGRGANGGANAGSAGGGGAAVPAGS